MKVTIARHLGEGRVEYDTYTDPYKASNLLDDYCGRVAAVVQCESIYTIGTGEWAKQNCFDCPCERSCLASNRSYIGSAQTEPTTVTHFDFSSK